MPMLLPDPQLKQRVRDDADGDNNTREEQRVAFIRTPYTQPGDAIIDFTSKALTLRFSLVQINTWTQHGLLYHRRCRAGLMLLGKQERGGSCRGRGGKEGRREGERDGAKTRTIRKQVLPDCLRGARQRAVRSILPMIRTNSTPPTD